MSGTAFGRRDVPRGGTIQRASPVKRAPVVSAPAAAYEAAAEPARVPSSPPHWVQVSLSKTVLCIFFFAAMIGLLVHLQAPSLMRDVRLAGTYEIDLLVEVNHGKCEGYTIIHFCDVSLTWDDNGTAVTEDTRFIVTAFSVGRQPLIPVRSSADPQAISVDYAVNGALQNRVWSFLFWVGVCAAGMITMIVRLLTGRYQGGSEDVWTA